MNNSTLVLTLNDADEYAEPMNKVGDDYWRYFADDHALTEVPPSALAARTAKPKRLRHREMMDGKVRRVPSLHRKD